MRQVDIDLRFAAATAPRLVTTKAAGRAPMMRPPIPWVEPKGPSARPPWFAAVAVVCMLLASATATPGLEPSRQIDQYGHDVWTSQRGLPGEAVYQILQSPDGYLWLRTSGGLARFDGVRFVSMDSAIGRESVKALAMSADGDLLIRTLTRTVRYKDGTFVDYRPASPLPDGEIKTLFESRQHQVLIGADDFLYSAEGSGIRLIQRGTAAISSLFQDDAGTIWVGGGMRLYSYRGVGPLQIEDPSNRLSIISMGEDHKHQVWVGGTAGLYRLDKNSPDHKQSKLTKVNVQQISHQVNAILDDKRGNLWIGTAGTGLMRRRGDQVTSFGAIDGLSDNRVLSLFEDREGSLWVGTGSGLDRFRDTTMTTYTTSEGMASDTTRAAVATRDGSIFVICDNGGLSQIKDGVITAIKKIQGVKVLSAASLFEDKEGSLWISSMDGLIERTAGRYRIFDQDPRFFRRFIPALNEDDESMIFATSDTLAYRFKDGKILPFTIRGQSTPLSSPGDYTFSIYREPFGTLWFGTAKGLYQFVPGQDPAKARRSEIKFAVTSIADDGRGDLWLAGRTPGLLRYRISDGRVTHYAKKDGLFDDFPSRVLGDDVGNLWISTSNGIYRASLKDLDDFAEGRISTVPSEVYGIADGMKTGEASSPAAQPGGARGLDGKLWFTTTKGIVMVDPRHLMHNDLIPPVKIESVVIDGSETAATDYFQIPPGKDKIEFHYTALSLLIPDRVRFKYQLEGYDRQWVDAGSRRVAYYNNLPPGEYRFRVIAANNDGVWNNAGAWIGFRLNPRFYQTRWFWGLCALIVLLIAVGGHRLSTRLFRRRAAELSRLVAERTAELRASTAELEVSKRHLEQVAFLDSLTGLPNRRMFNQELRDRVAHSVGRRARFALLMIDLDQFKQTNDSSGHDAGDALLVEAANRLRAAVRETDCVARLGGDEFAILLSDDQDAVSIDVICARILDNFVPAALHNGVGLKTTPSIGIAMFPQDGETQETLCKSADLALYASKRAGGNSWQWYHPQPVRETAAVS